MNWKALFHKGRVLCEPVPLTYDNAEEITADEAIYWTEWCVYAQFGEGLEWAMSRADLFYLVYPKAEIEWKLTEIKLNCPTPTLPKWNGKSVFDCNRQTRWYRSKLEATAGGCAVCTLRGSKGNYAHEFAFILCTDGYVLINDFATSQYTKLYDAHV